MVKHAVHIPVEDMQHQEPYLAVNKLDALLTSRRAPARPASTARMAGVFPAASFALGSAPRPSRARTTYCGQL